MANLVRTGSTELSPQMALDPLRLMAGLMGWDPWRGLGTPAMGEALFVPRFEVRDTADRYVFTADLPGVKEEDLDLSLTGDRLTITGRREAEREETERYHTYERAYGAFQRAFTLPDGVDADHICADLKDGVLTVEVPKRKEAQPRKISLGGIVDKIKHALKA